MDLPIEFVRFRQIREDQNLTQSRFAKILETSSAPADIERGRTKISGHIVMQLLEKFKINPLWIYGKSDQKYLNPEHQNVTPRMISTDHIGKENILLINQKASAGYADNINDPEFFQNLPSFTFPIPAFRNASFRCFQIQGDSMMPAVLPGDWIIAKAVESISEIKNNEIYVVVERSGIRLKKIRTDIKPGSLSLISINPDYPVDQISYDQVSEIWHFHSKLSFTLENTSVNSKLDMLHKEIVQLKQILAAK